MLDNAQNEPYKFRTTNWVETNGELRGTYNECNHIKFKTSMIKSNLCDYSDAYILVSGTTIITGAEDKNASKGDDERNREVMFKNCAPFIDCISKINNTQTDNAKDRNDVMLLYNLIEYSDNYSKTWRTLWQYIRDEPYNQIVNRKSFISKIKITGKTPTADNTQNIEPAVLLKYLSNFGELLKCH